MSRPHLSVSTAIDYTLPIEEHIPLIAAAGFSHVSIGENTDHSGILDPRRRRRLAHLLREHGLEVDTVHGPRIDLHGQDLLPLTIVVAAELGAPVVVAHGGPFDFPAAELSERLATLDGNSMPSNPLWPNMAWFWRSKTLCPVPPPTSCLTLGVS